MRQRSAIKFYICLLFSWPTQRSKYLLYIYITYEERVDTFLLTFFFCWPERNERAFQSLHMLLIRREMFTVTFWRHLCPWWTRMCHTKDRSQLTDNTDGKDSHEETWWILTQTVMWLKRPPYPNCCPDRKLKLWRRAAVKWSERGQLLDLGWSTERRDDALALDSKGTFDTGYDYCKEYFSLKM